MKKTIIVLSIILISLVLFFAVLLRNNTLFASKITGFITKTAVINGSELKIFLIFIFIVIFFTVILNAFFYYSYWRKI